MSYIDTEKIIEKGIKIQKLADEYNVLINKLFISLLDVPYASKAWSGKSAIAYTKLISLDKEDFLNYGKNIKTFGSYLEKVGKQSDNAIATVSKKEKL